MKELTRLFRQVWDEERIPEKWKKRLIVKLRKKGDLRKCSNWREVTLLTVTSKILGRVIVNRIKSAVDGTRRKEQEGFRQGRGTTEQNFCTEHHSRASMRMKIVFVYAFR